MAVDDGAAERGLAGGCERGHQGPLLCVRPYTHTDHYWQVYFDTHKAVVSTFGAAGYPVPETPVAHRTL